MGKKRYQIEIENAQKTKEAEDVRRKNKCNVCDRNGHWNSECPQVCVECFNKDNSDLHNRRECPLKGQMKKDREELQKKREEWEKRKSLHCNLCDIDGHDLDMCKKKCRNPRCADGEPHWFQDCINRLCRECFSRHASSADCDYDKGKRYIIGQYKNNNVCECTAVNFWSTNLAPGTIGKYSDRATWGVFFHNYPKPYRLNNCPYGGAKCGYEYEPSKYCNGHHIQAEHFYFH